MKFLKSYRALLCLPGTVYVRKKACTLFLIRTLGCTKGRFIYNSSNNNNNKNNKLYEALFQNVVMY